MTYLVQASLRRFPIHRVRSSDHQWRSSEKEAMASGFNAARLAERALVRIPVTCHLAAEKFVGLKREFSISKIKGPFSSVDLRMASHSGSDKNASHFSWRCASDSHASR